jgi:hypothetical protein
MPRPKPRLQVIADAIAGFDRQCEADCYTDTGAVWDLLEAIRTFGTSRRRDAVQEAKRTLDDFASAPPVED